MSTIETPQSAISFAPPPQWHDHDYHGHVVQFYSEDEFLVDAISRFLGVSLAAGDAAIVLATKTHREGIARKVKERGLDVTSSEDRKSTRLNSSHSQISYAVFCLKKKKKRR